MFLLCSYHKYTTRQNENRQELTFGLERLAGGAQSAKLGGFPAVGVGYLGERAAGQRPESVERPADRHQSKGRDLLGGAAQRLDLVLAADWLVVMTVPRPRARQ